MSHSNDPLASYIMRLDERAQNVGVVFKRCPSINSTRRHRRMVGIVCARTRHFGFQNMAIHNGRVAMILPIDRPHFVDASREELKNP
jgi:hypothetical protein